MTDEHLEDDGVTSETSQDTQKQRPVARFSGSGGISVAVWKTKSEQGRDNYSVRIDRTYRVGEGEFKSTQYLREGDLLRTQQLLNQADQWIEQDKAKGRANASGQGATEDSPNNVSAA